jgi:hypothetical protein
LAPGGPAGGSSPSNSLKADRRLSLREDPRFQALVNDPANDAPLF